MLDNIHDNNHDYYTSMRTENYIFSDNVMPMVSLPAIIG